MLLRSGRGRRLGERSFAPRRDHLRIGSGRPRPRLPPASAPALACARSAPAPVARNHRHAMRGSGCRAACAAALPASGRFAWWAWRSRQPVVVGVFSWCSTQALPFASANSKCPKCPKCPSGVFAGFPLDTYACIPDPSVQEKCPFHKVLDRLDALDGIFLEIATHQHRPQSRALPLGSTGQSCLPCFLSKAALSSASGGKVRPRRSPTCHSLHPHSFFSSLLITIEDVCLRSGANFLAAE